MTNEKLIEGCLSGDRKSQRILFDRYTKSLLSVSRRYSRNTADAEDVVQDSWIKIFNGLKTYNEMGQLEAWMKKIVIRVALRKQQSAAFKKEDLGIADNFHPAINTDVVEKMSADEILDKVLRLPTGYKEIFKLFVIEGYSHREIGELMNIEESTSRAKLTKARKWMRESIVKSQKKFA